jgi:hypothetical protein
MEANSGRKGKMERKSGVKGEEKWRTLERIRERGWGIVGERGTMIDERNRMLETVHCTLTGTVRVHMWPLL